MNEITLVFATNNNHKIKEAINIIPPGIKILSLRDIDGVDDLPETGKTIKANAHQKARYIYEKFGMNCFADDTGLEVLALNGEPGVYSARYAGNKADSTDNINKLLFSLKGIEERHARFRTVIALIINGHDYYFEGIVDGSITEQPAVTNGFGYDSVFRPQGSDKTFAELTDKEKNSMSHRAIAINKLAEFLRDK